MPNQRFLSHIRIHLTMLLHVDVHVDLQLKQFTSSQPVHVKFILNFSNYTILFSLGVTFLSFISPNPNIGPKGMSVPLTYRAHSLKGQGDSLQAQRYPMMYLLEQVPLQETVILWGSSLMMGVSIQTESVPSQRDWLLVEQQSQKKYNYR